MSQQVEVLFFLVKLCPIIPAPFISFHYLLIRLHLANTPYTEFTKMKETRQLWCDNLMAGDRRAVLFLGLARNV